MFFVLLCACFSLGSLEFFLSLFPTAWVAFPSFSLPATSSFASISFVYFNFIFKCYFFIGFVSCPVAHAFLTTLPLVALVPVLFVGILVGFVDFSGFTNGFDIFSLALETMRSCTKLYVFSSRVRFALHVFVCLEHEIFHRLEPLSLDCFVFLLTIAYVLPTFSL